MVNVNITCMCYQDVNVLSKFECSITTLCQTYSLDLHPMPYELQCVY